MKKSTGERTPWLARRGILTLAGCLAALTGCFPVRPYLPVEVTPRAEQHFIAGRKLYRREDFEGAMKEFRAAIAQCPRYAEAHRFYQDASVAVRRIEPLVDEYEDLCNAHPRDPLYRYLYGRLQITDKAQKREFNRALASEWSFPWAWYGLGSVAHHQRRPWQAEQYYKRAVTASDGRLTEPMIGLGKIYGLTGRYEEARKVLARAAKVDPADPLPHLVLAVLYRNQRRYGLAIAECERAIEKMPGCRSACNMLRDIIEKHPAAARGDAVRTCLQSALKSFPGHPDLLATLGLVEMTAGNDDAALAHFKKARANGLCPADYANPMRLLYVRKGDYDRALAVWREKVPEELTDCPGNVAADRYAALSHATTDAMQHRSNPTSALALARAYARAGWVDEAAAIAERLAPALDAAVPIRDRVKRHIDLCKRIEQLFRKDYVRFQTKQRYCSVKKVLGEIEDLASEATGLTLEGTTKTTHYPFLGSVTGHKYPQRSKLMKYFDEFNQLLIIGKPSGSAPVECGLMTVVSRQPHRKSLLWGAPVRSDRVLVDGLQVTGYHETVESRRTGGQAIDGFFYTNVNAIWRWCCDDIRVLDRLWRGPMPDRKRPPCLIDRMSGEPTRLTERVYREECKGDRRTYFLKAIDLVDCHELGHVVDAQTHLPISKHFFRDLFLIVDCGFSPVKVLAFTEGNAELTALAHARSPRLVLASLTKYLESGFDDSPHSRGYRKILEWLVSDIHRRPYAYREIDANRRIVDQLTALPSSKIRSLARRLAEKWRLPQRVRETGR
ncbi:MAG: tetratricopeptide repeat protein [Planctomycetes bacterium]|nr:tetratricopeptide repeat protein [Planctomycetota bacterium]